MASHAWLAGWHGFGRRLHISHKLEPDARGAEWPAIAVDEQPLVGCSRLPLRQLFSTATRFLARVGRCVPCGLAGKAHAIRAIEPDRLGAQIKRFLYSCPAVVVERQQRVIAHAFKGRAAWAGQGSPSLPLDPDNRVPMPAPACWGMWRISTRWAMQYPWSPRS